MMSKRDRSLCPVGKSETRLARSASSRPKRTAFRFFTVGASSVANVVVPYSQQLVSCSSGIPQDSFLSHLGYTTYYRYPTGSDRHREGSVKAALKSPSLVQLH